MANNEHILDNFTQKTSINQDARDQRVFEQVMEEGEGDVPTWEDYDGMHYVEAISRTVVEQVQGQLDRGFAVKMG